MSFLPVLRVLALAAALAAPGLTAAQDPCLECHGQAGLVVGGRSLWLDADAYRAGVHGRLSCRDCHKGLDDFPHGGAGEVRCDLPCHAPGASHEAIAKAEAAGVHGALRGAPCTACHLDGAAPAGAAADELCRECHGVRQGARGRYPDTPGAFGQLAHADASSGRPLPTCRSCHGSHGAGGGDRARTACRAAGCHPGEAAGFEALFDHGGAPRREPWGGAGPLAAAACALVGLIALVHAVRG